MKGNPCLALTEQARLGVISGQSIIFTFRTSTPSFSVIKGPIQLLAED